MAEVAEEIVVSESGYSLPVEDLLTGRGAIFGKSGSGKSNSMTVVAEELLELSLPLLIVDQDGEYHGLKEEYDVVHAGPDPDCDRTIGVDDGGDTVEDSEGIAADSESLVEDGEDLADEALEDNLAVVLDVSGFMAEESARDLVHAVVRRLFVRENEVQKPFLLIVEEVHEYVPERGGLDDLGEMLIRVAKRGRKRGLGLCGVSQRPASVDKDFITQCDWIVWHRLTWRNDTKVVGRILGSEYADRVQDLADGEGYVMTDWAEDVRRVQFRLKRTLDVGATPGLDEFGDDHWDAHVYHDRSADAGSSGGSSTGSGAGGPAASGSASNGSAAGGPPASGSAAGGSATSESAAASAEAAPDPGDGRSDSQDGGSASARDATIVDRSGGRGSDRTADSGSDRTDRSGSSRGPPEDTGYEGNPIWEIGQMFAYIVGAVIFRFVNAIRWLVPNVRPRRSSSRNTPVGFPRKESVDWKLTSVLMVVVNLLLLAIVGYVFLFVLN